MRKAKNKPKVRGLPLRAGESVLVVGRPPASSAWYKYLLTLGLYNLWWKRNVSVLTNQRIFLGKGVWSRREASIPLSRIEDATFVRRGPAAYCEVSSLSSGGFRPQSTRVGPLRWGTARQFARGIDERE